MTIVQERASTARRAMIDSQLRVSGVNDPAVLAALDRVAREDFVPAAQRDHAYIDRALPLGDGQALPAPLFHGLALCEARIQPGERVLVVAAAGYLAALATELGATVRQLGPAEAVAAATPAEGPCSLILIDGAIEQLPAALGDQLAEGGRIVTGTVERGVTRLAVGAKAAGTVALLPVTDIGIPVLAEFAAPKRWSF
ncbi:protein-L-isoaspartate O-methyltransferase [Novosphingobium piscinae]|uniref:Protein-L-isoaspartate O-methyltransferase n=1 Tax=Novosphingobium piscinae TaxID=1507448 RepID=A0A7X1G120_9SPHN|nr:protein-L-isoaspartate O-methyltransferase [Novosphingobium piscinae]MBC2670539.1 protein-L-isoaspartate O-methyltransferase [Novosphingobium piscinae]